MGSGCSLPSTRTPPRQRTSSASSPSSSACAMASAVARIPTPSGLVSASTREATLTVSPTTVASSLLSVPRQPRVTWPVWMPTPMATGLLPAGAARLRARTAAWMARAARSASPAREKRDRVPSPRNLSTEPLWREMQGTTSARRRLRNWKTSCASMASLMDVKERTSQNMIVSEAATASPSSTSSVVCLPMRWRKDSGTKRKVAFWAAAMRLLVASRSRCRAESAS
mmetsp:Transcript_3821/g.13513  ORF Transcript_3821/g.13513 Transcript_3821/m.13513 type:complete len:227 (+) Transcript_3821:308-988(+)